MINEKRIYIAGIGWVAARGNSIYRLGKAEEAL